MYSPLQMNNIAPTLDPTEGMQSKHSEYPVKSLRLGWLELDGTAQRTFPLHPEESRNCGWPVQPPTVHIDLPLCALWSGAMACSRIGFEPGKKLANAASSKRNARVARSVVEMNRVAIRPDGLSTRENDIFDISAALICRFRAEHP